MHLVPKPERCPSIIPLIGVSHNKNVHNCWEFAGPELGNGTMEILKPFQGVQSSL